MVTLSAARVGLAAQRAIAVSCAVLGDGLPLADGHAAAGSGVKFCPCGDKGFADQEPFFEYYRTSVRFYVQPCFDSANAHLEVQ